MINTAIKSHWKMAFKVTLKAVKVTLQVCSQMIKAHIYRMRISEKLMEERRELAKFEQEAINKLLDRFS